MKYVNNRLPQSVSSTEELTSSAAVCMAPHKALINYAVYCYVRCMRKRVHGWAPEHLAAYLQPSKIGSASRSHNTVSLDTGQYATMDGATVLKVGEGTILRAERAKKNF